MENKVKVQNSGIILCRGIIKNNGKLRNPLCGIDQVFQAPKPNNINLSTNGSNTTSNSLKSTHHIPSPKNPTPKS